MKQQFRFPSNPCTNQELSKLCWPKPLLNDTAEEYHWSLFFDNNPALRNDLYRCLNNRPCSQPYGLIYNSSLATWKLFKEYFKSNTNARHIRVSPLSRSGPSNFDLTPFAVRITQCDKFSVYTELLNLTDVSGIPTKPEDSWVVKKINSQTPSVAIHDFGQNGPIWLEVNY